MSDKPCLRCHGEGQTEIDRAPPVEPEMCHRCGGSGKEPEWPQSPLSTCIEYAYGSPYRLSFQIKVF